MRLITPSVLQTRRTLAVIAVLLLLASGSAAAAAQDSEPFRLTRDVLSSLESAQRAAESLAKIETLSDPIASAMNAMLAIRKAITALRLADSQIAPYVGSSDETVQAMAGSMHTIYGVLIECYEGDLRVQERLIDFKPSMQLGPLVNEASASAARADEVWRILPLTVGVLGHALVDMTRTSSDGRRTHLVLTSNQRASFLKDIERLFGPDAAAGNVAGLHAAKASAGLLAHFLRQPWQSSDQ